MLRLLYLAPYRPITFQAASEISRGVLEESVPEQYRFPFQFLAAAIDKS